MQASEGTCRISALYEDLLRRIFLENTFPLDIYRLINVSRFNTQPIKQIRPLTTARHCSQVSRHWRSIFLSTPSIWARLIDLDGFRQTTDEWMKQVMARSGNALLWVYGRLVSDMHDLFFSFLEETWRRVQMLVIRADNQNYL
ncbi:hypothetical protein D9613_010842 [Agrocybe pediades]|uniref:F-box domain-containing protein n=1 Tax=Agrocybe pediades TaxID=84607 RepID=A0A8H4VKW5_9AGAR|nr:hypothetical protein D9613_010842 [Agrocybe pediades]